MKEYHATAASKKYGFDHMPPDEMRLKDEEIKSTEEYERETLGMSKGLSSVEEEEFDFSNSRKSGNNSVTKSTAIQETDNEVTFIS
jgi:hypothetical protein